MVLLTPERLLNLAYHYPDLHNTWYLIATASLLELNLIDEIPIILHFALRQQLFEFSKDEESVVRNEIMIKLASDSIKSSERCVRMYSTGVKIPDVLIPLAYHRKIPLNYKYNRGEDIIRKQQFIVNQINEVVLNLVSMCGLPKVINGLTAIKAATPTRLSNHALKRINEVNIIPNDPNGVETIDGPISASSIDTKVIKSNLIRGSNFWNSIYTKGVNIKIKKQMINASPDLWYYVYNHIYSYLLSYNTILTAKKTSLVLIACLIIQDVTPQLKGHLKGALNNGASEAEIAATKKMVLEICEWNGHSWKNQVNSVAKL
ncbi:uncharacterized protein KGF55_002583 [Candida pseudojiufengensis]|uniref:uncharacterized protein n=1 Tax=Candida pseudojiufengensis TaxID=497109 RepID=UPI002224F1D6|nr:uncharacterized protein KGF55_002583 [Candida pseudojiufengensis]KAI5963703.1 hypothetical protein KGF55_002583 [Candida pseudojiufengensis]